MAEETEDIKALKLELAFDEASAKLLDEMVNMSRAPSREKVLFDAIRVYDWYLRNQQYPLIQKRGDDYVKIDLQL
ncbi:MAG: hypothetical protein ACTSYO_08150 [Candidatus Ranarchaeia archaeon]